MSQGRFGFNHLDDRYYIKEDDWESYSLWRRVEGDGDDVRITYDWPFRSSLENAINQINWGLLTENTILKKAVQP